MSTLSKINFHTFNIGTLAAAGVQYGHTPQQTDTRIFDFLVGLRNGVYVFNLVHSFHRFRYAVSFLADLTARRGRVLFVNPDQVVFKSLAILSSIPSHNSFVVSNKKLPGLLTNFLVLRRTYANLKNMKSVPQFVVVTHANNHHAVQEASALNIPCFGVFDSNTNASAANFYNVPGNDDSFIAKAFYLSTCLTAINAGWARGVRVWAQTRTIKYQLLTKHFRGKKKCGVSLYYLWNQLYGSLNQVSLITNNFLNPLHRNNVVAKTNIYRNFYTSFLLPKRSLTPVSFDSTAASVAKPLEFKKLKNVRLFRKLFRRLHKHTSLVFKGSNASV